MLFSTKTRDKLFVVFAAVLCLTAIYHFVGIFYNLNDLPVWRNLLFVFIDLFCAYGALKRPNYFIYLVVLLIVQQCYSHGTYLMDMWHEQKQIHWISVFDLLLCPIAMLCLYEDYKMKNKRH
jgi:hypothetical protein